MPNSINKSYNSIKELPSEVRSSFDERDQKKWMDAYNEASQNEEPEQAKVDAWMSMVDAPSSLAVETWGSVEVRDADGELVPIETIAENADKFIMNGGLMHDSHSNVPMGTVWDWEIRKHPKTGEDGIVFYFNVYRDGEVFERARDDILSGRKNAVSIGAEAPRGGYKCDDRGCYVERDVTDLYELSICETPANPEAYFINVGKDIAKSKKPLKGEVLRIGIQDYIVHQDYTTCPLQKCKHDLLEKGFKNVHLTKKGHIIAKSRNEFKLLKTIEKMGFPFRYDLKKEQFEIMPDYGVEQAIEEAVGNGWAHEDQIGHVCLTKEIPKEVFMDWYDRGFITKIGDFYCLKADDVAKDTVTINKGRRRDITMGELEELVRHNPMFDYDPWESFCETLTRFCEAVMQEYKIPEEYEDPVRDMLFNMSYPDGPGPWIPSRDMAISIWKNREVSKGKTPINPVRIWKPSTGEWKTIKYDEDYEKYVVNGEWEYYGDEADMKESAKKKVKKSVCASDLLDTLAELEDSLMDEGDDDLIELVREEIQNVKWGAFESIESNLNEILEKCKTLHSANLCDDALDLLSEIGKTKKKVVKDGGAMGVGDAGAMNPVYGATPTSLTNPDKKYGKKRKAKKELYDEGNTHGPAPSKIPKMKKSWNSIQKRCPKGSWKDEKTGECIPIDEWKSKYGDKDKTNESEGKPENDSPKNESSKDKTNVNTAKDLNGSLDKFRKKYNLKCEVGMSNGTIAIRVDPTTRRSTMGKYLEFIKDFAEKNNLQIDPTSGNYYLRLGSKEDIENNNKILQEKRAKESEERKKQKESRKAEWEKKESEKSDAWKSAELDGAIQLIESIGNARENFYAIKVPALEIEARFFKDNFSKKSDEEEADEFRGKETPPIPDMKSGLSSSSDSLVIDKDSYVAYDDDKDRAYAYDKEKKKWAVIQNFSRYLDEDIEDILKDESTVMP